MATTALSIDMSLPAMPEIAKSFHAPVNAVQLTLSLFLLGYAVGQLLCGPISDRMGRRPVMLAALYAYSVAGFACFLSHSLAILVFARLIQGLAASAGPVISRAMVRDCYDQRSAAGVLSQTTQVIIAVPLLAPMVGGYLLVLFGWPSIFLMLGCCGILLALVCQRILPETLGRRVSETPAEPTVSWWRGFGIVLSHRPTLRHLLAGCFMTSGLFAYISSAPYVVIEVFGVARQHFGYVFSMTALALLAGASVNRALLSRYNSVTLLRVGATCILAGGLLMPVLSWFHVGGLGGVVGPMMLFIFGMGVVLPNATAAAMAPHGQLAGVASSLMGAGQTAGAALAGYIVSLLYTGTSMATAATVAVAAVLVFASVDHSGLPATPADTAALSEMESEGELALHESGV
jgi:DHA1 family bicyclomycin/chloramphenicol resistance-like MFS transporter